MSNKFRIFGAGKWGLAIAHHLSNQKNEVQIFDIEKDRIDSLRKSNYCEELEIKFNEHIGFNYLDKETLTKHYVQKENNQYNIIAVSSAGFSIVLNEFREYFSTQKSLIWLTKGIDNTSGLLFHEIVNELISHQQKKTFDMCMVSGPSFAIDLVKNKKIKINSASNNILFAKEVSEVLSGQNFLVEPIKDIIGVQVASILKNIAATMAGVLVALDYDEDSIMSIIDRAKKEVLKISSSLQLKSKDYRVSDEEMLITLESPACHGDMILTCLNDESRNRQFGRKIGSGEALDSALKDLGTVESYACTKTLHENKKRFNFGDITASAYKILYQKKDPVFVVKELLNQKI